MEEKEVNLDFILEGCKNNNQQSQEKLYKHFYGYAMSICLRYSRNRQEAREVLNEGFLKIFTHLNQYDKNFPFHSWIRRILINTAIDFYRAKRRQPLFTTLEDAYFVIDQNMEDFEITHSISVLPILQKLSPAYRIVFNLYVMEGYKHHEIAALLDISVSTSKTNLARAKQRLKQMLKSTANYKLKASGNG